MWVLTTRGFFSVVAHRDDPDVVRARARAREDLESLAELVGPFEIRHTPDADYAFRAEISRERWSVALILLAAEIDYPNFKDAVAARHSPARADTYHRVWSELRELQTR